jgi:DMSO/TMAO reductase YedYZ molybdopterin-dependent catalytic subunit
MAGAAGRGSRVDPGLGWREAIRAGLVGLRQDPLNCEVPPELLDAEPTPTSQFFRRNHFGIPELDPAPWRLEIGGLVRHRLSLSLDELKRFGSVSTEAVLECAGNGRSSYAPAVEGEQWGSGAVGNATWTGVPLADVLDSAGIQPEAVDVVFRGADEGTVDGGTEPITFERSLSVAEATSSSVLLAYAMNNEPLPVWHGYPVRLVVPSKYAVASVKWLTSIAVIDKPFEGFFQAEHYVFEWQHGGSVVREPVADPGVRALITAPPSGSQLPSGQFTVRGVAWSGAAPVALVEVSVAGGQWQSATLVGNPGQHGWQRWELPLQSAGPGEQTIRARAADAAGRTQLVQPEWNRLGYGGNFIHEVSVLVR